MPIEQHAPGLERIVDLHQGIEELARGFGGASGPAEGPVWWQEGGYLVFSDIGNNRRMQWSPGAGDAAAGTYQRGQWSDARSAGASWRANTSPGVSPARTRTATSRWWRIGTTAAV